MLIRLLIILFYSCGISAGTTQTTLICPAGFKETNGNCIPILTCPAGTHVETSKDGTQTCLPNK